MRTERDLSIAKQFSDAIRQQYPDSQIWSLGSWEDAGREWDFDFCIVLETLDRSAKKAIREVAWKLGFINETVLTTVSFSHHQFEQGPIAISPLVQNIRRKGIPLL